MNTNSKVTVTSLLALALIATALPAQQVTAPAETSTNDEVAPVTTVQNSAPASANSKVRIVRLSDKSIDVILLLASGIAFAVTAAVLACAFING